MSAADRAAALRALHVPGTPLVVLNVWDVASAKVMAEVEGVRALATASHAIAASLGYDDGEGTPAAEMIGMAGRIAAAVELPVSADLEAGYGDPGGTASAAWDVGVVGLNLEDTAYPGGSSLLPLDDAVAAVAAVRAAVPEFVINARTDVYLRGEGNVADAAERGNAYLAAGGDCIFVPGVTDLGVIRELCSAIDGPVSVLARPGGPTVAEIADAGAARISVGPFGQYTALAALRDAAQAVYGEGSYAQMRV